MKTGVVKYNSSKTCFFLPLFSTRSGSFSKVRFILLKSCIPVWLQCGGSHFTILSPACQPVWPTGGSWFWLQKGDDLLIKYFEWEAMRLFLYSIYVLLYHTNGMEVFMYTVDTWALAWHGQSTCIHKMFIDIMHNQFQLINYVVNQCYLHSIQLYYILIYMSNHESIYI